MASTQNRKEQIEEKIMNDEKFNLIHRNNYIEQVAEIIEKNRGFENCCEAFDHYTNKFCRNFNRSANSSL